MLAIKYKYTNFTQNTFLLFVLYQIHYKSVNN